VNIPDQTTAAAFPRYSVGKVLADSASLRWPGLYVRYIRFPRVVDRLLVPATAEPLVVCVVRGTAEFRERDSENHAWVTRELRSGALFVTRSQLPYEVHWTSAPGQELEVMIIHVALDQHVAALEAIYPGREGEAEVVDFFGFDEALSHLCFACAEMLKNRVAADSRRLAGLTQLMATYLVEGYMDEAPKAGRDRGGLPIRQLRKVEDYVSHHLDREISVETLAELVELSPFHFSRVFKQTTGVSPLKFVTQERIALAQQMIRETSRSVIEIGLEVGYANPSHFAQVFRKVVGVTPTEFRSTL
jgi:AraC family transcriptional regulator